MVRQNISAVKARGSRNFITPTYNYLIIVFAILAVILIGVILYFSLSQAIVYITPEYREQKVGFAVQVIDKEFANTKEVMTSKLIGEIKETTVEKSKTFEAKAIEVPQTKASGQVTIINNYSKNQPLITATRLLTPDGKLYRLTQTVNVPAGGRITATAEADQEGSQFIIGQTKFTIPGLWEGLQDKIYAETQGFAVGSIVKHEISQSAIDQAKEELRQELIEEAKAELGLQNLSEQEIVTEIIKYSTDAKAGSDQKEFTINLSIGVKALIFDQEKLKEIASSDLPEIYQTNNSFIEINPDSFEYETILLDENSEHLLAQIKGEYQVKVADVQVDPAQLTKMEKQEAVKYLENFGDIKKADVMLPFWSKNLPALADKITIQFEN
ncbi:MAG: hypothetical protein COU22_01515 [Candidatus Komeilibacteria bacterium CG10_big_fil_rev_8_21_14_0_10_41_13]|uniref:Baseplate protein J-like domain-containing protein n=1 Tax=Candidatus Komeilibacteria bacterium CG10_big_fil_rev_8_21_14_0_10_41_13 TaxID=1974476 RepID=A0A2M6WCT7_9BACT|nr:MAG: hypothetical protein COU22_01515 [Candidatus Komeilibacteria bacterium CG10_big_fil_rev_8_21_14_0_10_41_13]